MWVMAVNRPVAQLILVSISAIYFLPANTIFAAIYGGLISLTNAWLIARLAQHYNTEATVNTIVASMFLSVVMRMVLVAGLVLMGFLVFQLAPNALIVGLIAGQIGFLIDKSR